VAWCEKGAEAGVLKAQIVLGFLYFEGKSVPQNYALAQKWWLAAAQQGESHAQNSVGWMYLKGLGVRCDSRKAAEWFQKSAEQGYVVAQLNFGYLLEHGTGVPLDYPEAYKWYQLAAAQGNTVAKSCMKSLAQIMTPKQLKESTSRVLSWHQKSEAGDVTPMSLAAIEAEIEQQQN
jgi:hypothetical protein